MSCRVDPESYREICCRVIREAGARLTNSRIAVIECLGESARPLSPREILDQISAGESGKALDRVSVYRILEFLKGLNLVHQVAPRGEFLACTHLDCGAPLHMLTCCAECGHTAESEMPEEVAASVQWYLTKQLGFEPSEHFLQINGRCSRCTDGSTIGSDQPPT